ncbi:uncharacterized protein LOC141671268 isoform X2 [Apium graveolens]|uniref:uncharacterized protein LOC141671268 isoform X2 n=1 Tax=Apium graveolens TaxID=4045 RepID=UPI003D7A07A0
MPKPALGPQRRTNAIIWFAAIVCAVVAVAVIAIGLFVIISYLVSLVIKAKNDNVKNHAEFYGLVLALNFHGLPVAKLVNAPFNVKKNDSREFVYVVKSDQIPLRSVYRDYVQSSLAKKEVSFEMKGKVKTRWRVWVAGSVKFSLNMDCDLQFFVPNGSFTYRSPCSSKSS